MELILPDEKYLVSYKEARDEFIKNGITEYELFDADQIDILKKVKDYRDGKNLPAGYVPATYLWLVEGGEFIAEVSIRHGLTDALMQIGGHIGYAVRADKQKQGYGSLLLALALNYAFDIIGLKKVLITCGDDNVGSYRVIENNGGILQDKITTNVHGQERLTRRYWIHADSKAIIKM